MKYWIGCGAAFAAGLIVGWVASNGFAEAQLRKEEAEETARLIADNRTEGIGRREKTNIFEEYPVNDPEDEVVVVGGKVEVRASDTPPPGVDPEETIPPNDYIGAVTHAEEGPEIEYIDFEQFDDEEDGLWKGQMVFLLSDDGPTVTLDGAPCDDWPERVGAEILRDMYVLIPPTAINQLLYVRNHERGEDYEVIRDTP